MKHACCSRALKSLRPPSLLSRKGGTSGGDALLEGWWQQSGRCRFGAHSVSGDFLRGWCRKWKADAGWGQVALHKQLAQLSPPGTQRCALLAGIGNWSSPTCHLIKSSVTVPTVTQLWLAPWSSCLHSTTEWPPGNHAVHTAAQPLTPWHLAPCLFTYAFVMSVNHGLQILSGKFQK